MHQMQLAVLACNPRRSWQPGAGSDPHLLRLPLLRAWQQLRALPCCCCSALPRRAWLVLRGQQEPQLWRAPQQPSAAQYKTMLAQGAVRWLTCCPRGSGSNISSSKHEVGASSSVPGLVKAAADGRQVSREQTYWRGSGLATPSEHSLLKHLIQLLLARVIHLGRDLVHRARRAQLQGASTRTQGWWAGALSQDCRSWCCWWMRH
jgi:hypothetical protein